MRRVVVLVGVMAVMVTALTVAARAAEVKAYQVTGPIKELTDSKIVVEGVKDKETYEIARNADTKVTGELKVGATVTIKYRMTATAITAKEGAAAEAKESPKTEKKDSKKEAPQNAN